jgi:integrase
MASRHRTPKPKRANGEARPFWNEKRARFELFIELPRAADGARRRKRVSGASAPECLASATKLRATLLAGLDAPNDRRTVAQLLDLWLATLPGTVAPGTVDTYQRAARLYVAPTVGHVVAEQLRPSHVRDMLRALEARGLKPHTMRLARAVLRRGLEWAVGDELLGRNVVGNTDGPAVPPVKVDPLELDELFAILDAARGHRYAAAATLLMLLGLRRGELLGLSWSDVDLDASPPRLHVQRQVLRLTGVGLVLQDYPKTAKSNRVLPLDAMAVETLRAQRQAQREERMRIGVRPGEEYAELVFTTAQGLPVDPRAFARSLDRIARRAGLDKLNPHRLRHCMAAVALDAGVPLEVLSELLGHSSIRVTKDVYGTLLLGTKAAAVDAIGAAFRENSLRRGGYQRGYPQPSH